MLRLPHPSLHAQQQACIQSFIEEFQYQLSFHTPSAALQLAVNHTNTQATACGLSQPFDNLPNSSSAALQQGQSSAPHNEDLYVLLTAAKVRISRICSLFTQFGGKIREFTIGNGSFSVRFDTGLVEDSCYVEYVSAKQRWRVSVCPSGIPPRVVDETELTQGCQTLITTAGCVFKTASTTIQQQNKPVEIPAGSLRKVMQSLGFCTADKGALHRVYTSRMGRSINCTVTVIPLVSEHGENLCNEIAVENGSLMTRVHAMDDENVSGIVQRLRAVSKNSVTSLNGRKIVQKKLTGCNSIVML